jgi:tetratricopeptide (TPR) repeat protein
VSLGLGWHENCYELQEMPVFCGFEECSVWERVLSRRSKASTIPRPAAQKAQDSAYETARLIHKAGDLVSAQRLYEQMVQSGSRDWRVYFHLGIIAKVNGQIEESLARFDASLDLRPDVPETLMNRGVALQGLGQTTRAIESYQSALALKPDYPACYSNLGISFESAGYYDEAIFCCQTALKLKPDLIEPWSNLGASYVARGDLLLGIEAYDEAIRLDPAFAEAQFNRSLALLALERFQEGWSAYEWRRRKKLPFASRKYEKPEWSGPADANKTLLVWPEQGIGDEIFFASLLPDVAALQSKLILEVDGRLVNIFARSFPQAQVMAKGEVAPDFDVQIPLGSLPHYLRPNASSFGEGAAFLVPDRARAAVIRETINPHKRFTIGISWISKNEKSGIFRSIALRRLLECFEGLNVQLVSLQYGDDASALSDLQAEGASIEGASFIDKFRDVDGLVSLIEACDLVVSIDNSTVHFAGAIGKPTFVLLPTTPDWRWGRESTTSQWYQSVRLFRQERQNDWSSVIFDIRSTLQLIFASEDVAA